MHPSTELSKSCSRSGAEVPDSPEKKLQEAQLGLGDMAVSDFRRAAHDVADRVADYLEGLESQRVLPEIEPGDVRAQFSPTVPQAPEPLEQILADYARLIEPNITHWQHPGFMAYFCATASGPGILGEWLAAGLNSNVMLWKKIARLLRNDARIYGIVLTSYQDMLNFSAEAKLGFPLFCPQDLKIFLQKMRIRLNLAQTVVCVNGKIKKVKFGKLGGEDYLEILKNSKRLSKKKEAKWQN